MEKSLIVLDTNILLLDAYNLVTIAKKQPTDTIIVLPETVLDEIDSKKSGHSEIAYQARQFGRLLSRATRGKVTVGENMTISTLEVDNVEVWVCAVHHYPQFNDIEQNIRSDRKIIYVAESLAKAGYPVSFCSNDVMCCLRAEAIGLSIYEHRLVETTEAEFICYKTISEAVFSNLHDSQILDVNPDHKLENYNYVFSTEGSNQRKLATLSNGLIKVIGATTEAELRKQDLGPMNAGQLFLSKAIQDHTVDIVVCEAKAGSGKTAVAISNAIKLVMEGKYESITYVRTSVDDVEKEEQIGFLSGNNEKVEVYIRPLEDTLDFIARNRLKNSKDKKDEEKFEEKVLETIEKLRSRCRIKGIITLGMRGRTLRNTVFIVDEVGNFSKSSLQKVLTRVGEGCKVILIGSNNQIDNSYLNKYTNGLSVILDACKKTQPPKIKLHAVSLQKVVRGPIAEFAEDIFTLQS